MSDILLVDDDEVLCEKLSNTLSNEYSIDVANGGKTALNLLGKSEYKIVLLDVKMPGVDGIDVLSEMQVESIRTKVIMITGDSSTEIAVDALRNGAFSYLQKPLDLDEIRIEIERAFDKIEMESELERNRKLAAVGEMSAGIMHEINNPNSFIKGNVEYLNKAFDDLRNQLTNALSDSVIDNIADSLQAIQKGADRIETIVSKVKRFSRGYDSRHDSLFEPGEIVNESIQMVQESSPDEAPEIGLNRLVDSKSSNPEIYGNPEELKQVTVNLLENAIDAVSEQNGQAQVTCELNYTENRFILAVEDNGPGIPEDIRNRIFDPFFSTKPTAEGTGLGLSIVQGIVDQMRGELAVDSEPEVGTRIEVRIPRDQAE